MRKTRRYLFEDNDDVNTGAPENDLSYSNRPKARKSKDSLDDQIDSLILMYEQRAIKNDDDRLDEALFKRSLLTLLREQDEAAADDTADDSLDEPADAAMDDGTSADDPSGSEEMSANAAEKDLVPDLDIDQFTIKVARLIMNYRSLLEVEQVILNRAKNFLNENYGDVFVNRYLQTLDEQFGINSKEFDVSYNEDVPFGIGANPAGAGSVGG